jgi:hypothetical protein
MVSLKREICNLRIRENGDVVSDEVTNLSLEGHMFLSFRKRMKDLHNLLRNEPYSLFFTLRWSPIFTSSLAPGWIS